MSSTRLHSRFCLAIVTALALFGTPAAHAAKLKPQNLTRLIADAEQIVAGKVTDVADGVTERGMPYTEITIAVADSAKGELRGGKTYTFRQFGLLEPRRMPDGRVLVAVTPEGFPRWQEGEQVVAFLYRPATRTGLQTTAGLAQGKLTVLNGRIANEFNNRGLFADVEISEDLLTEKERAMLTSEGPVDAATFVGLVGRAVTENWIEKGEMR
ncbi:MAG TPA: hypothetical protein VLT59_03920 [Steroidobacteraceae bacterium]|nr:hypothetical protein [Steroidobacteraceae bacterium]